MLHAIHRFVVAYELMRHTLWKISFSSFFFNLVALTAKCSMYGRCCLLQHISRSILVLLFLIQFRLHSIYCFCFSCAFWHCYKLIVVVIVSFRTKCDLKNWILESSCCTVDFASVIAILLHLATNKNNSKLKNLIFSQKLVNEKNNVLFAQEMFSLCIKPKRTSGVQWIKKQ